MPKRKARAAAAAAVAVANEAGGGGTAASPAACPSRAGNAAPGLPTVVLDEATARLHNSQLLTATYSLETAATTDIWDLPERAEQLITRARALCSQAAAVAEMLEVHQVATDAEIARVTSAGYRQHLRTKVQGVEAQGGDDAFLDRDQTTALTTSSEQCARHAAGCVLAAARRAFGAAAAAEPNASRRAFALCRPPGHHNGCTEALETMFDVEAGTAGNFVDGCHGGESCWRCWCFCAASAAADASIAGCIYNSVAMAVQALRASEEHGKPRAFRPKRGDGSPGYSSSSGLAERLVVLDVDAHAGDGTALQFWFEPAVLTISIHWDQTRGGHDMYPFMQGAAGEVGGEGAEGSNINLPLPDGAPDGAFAAAVAAAVAKIKAFGPTGIFVACGFDALDEDESSQLRLTPVAFGGAVAALVGEFAACPLVLSLEGGYTTGRMADAFEAVVRAMGD